MTNQTVSETLQSIQELYGADFHLALTQTAATMANPAHGDRLRKAMDLVRRGAVTLHGNGTATVNSNGHPYEIVDECPCEDSRRRSPYCKHYLAVQLLQHTMKRLSQGHNDNGAQTTQEGPGTPPAPPSSQVWAVSEAPASCCLKFKIDGIEILYTMRDVDDHTLFPRVKQMLARLQDKIGQTGAETPSPEASGMAMEPPQGWCPKHDVQMRRCRNDTGSWWAHLLADGTWCKGK
jgi:hypothetical protein